MKSSSKIPIVVALVLTLLVCLLPPYDTEKLRVGQGPRWFFEVHLEGWTSGVFEAPFHWPTFIFELAAIWVGFFLYKIVTKKEES